MNEPSPATRGYAVRIRIECVDILKTKLSEIEIQSWEPEVGTANADEHLEMIVAAVLPLVGSGEVRIFKECWQ